MYAESRKIQLIEEVLKIDSNAVLSDLETVLKNASRNKPKKKSIYDFVGILTKKEAVEMRKVIKETSEKIHPDDWK